MQVTVLHNTTRDASFGFRNQFGPARLLEVHAFHVDASFDKDQVHTAEQVFEQLNVGGDLVPAEDYTTEYRAKHLRSLSVGDVLKLEWAPGCYRFLAVGRFGWDRVEEAEVLGATLANVFPCRSCQGLAHATYVATNHVELQCGHVEGLPARA